MDEERFERPGAFETYAVEEGAKLAKDGEGMCLTLKDGDEMYPAVRIEGRRNPDGGWPAYRGDKGEFS